MSNILTKERISLNRMMIYIYIYIPTSVAKNSTMKIPNEVYPKPLFIVIQIYNDIHFSPQVLMIIV